MKNPVSLKNKLRDMAIGFVGWVVFRNLIYLLFITRITNSPYTIGYVLWFFALITSVVLVIKKRLWVTAGVSVPLVISAIIWIVSLTRESSLSHISIGEKIIFASLPFPLGITLFWFPF